ncbi:MAG: hypothetical protein WC165_04040 [Dysgonamonadaceae bacterium]
MQKKSFLSVITLSVILLSVMFMGCTNNVKTLSVDELLEQASALAGKQVVIEGIATHVCQKSGMKLFLKGNADDKTIRAESNSSIGKFDPNAVDKKVRVQGILVEEIVKEADHHETENLVTDSAACETEQNTQKTYYIAADAYQIIQ